MSAQSLPSAQLLNVQMHDISRETNKNFLIAWSILSLSFVLLRSICRYFKIQRFPIEAEDICMYVAEAAFLTSNALLIDMMSTTYALNEMAVGTVGVKSPPEAEIVKTLKEFFATDFTLKITLWGVKLCLLFIFRKLTMGIQSYERAWYAVMAFIVLSFTSLMALQFTSCPSMHDWFTPNSCGDSTSTKLKGISSYYLLAVDLLSDLLIMSIPVRVLWTVRMTLTQKLSVGLVFVVGIFTMITAIVAVVVLNQESHYTDSAQRNPTWLILWRGIGGVISITTGCLPTFAVFIRGYINAKSTTTSTYPSAYSRNTNSNIASKPSSSFQSWRMKRHSRDDSILMTNTEVGGEDLESSTTKLGKGDSGMVDVYATNSEKSLVEGEIVVTQGWS